MWPDYDEQTVTTEAAEWALERAYHAPLALWLSEMIPKVLAGDDSTPPDLDVLVSEDAQALWDELVELSVIPVMAMMWCFAYVQTAYVLCMDLASDTRPVPALTADGEPDDDRPPWEIPGNPGYLPPSTPEEREEALKQLAELRRKDAAKIKWTTDPRTGAPIPIGTPDNPYGLAEWWVHSPYSPEEYERRSARIRDQIMNPPPTTKGISPSGASANWSSDFPTWLEHMHEKQATFRALAEKFGGPTFGELPPEPERLFPRTMMIRNALPEQTAANTYTEDRTSPKWVEANWPAPTAPRSGQQRLGLDLVARMTALAWDTDPDQVKMAALLLWDQVGSRRRLEMFLGSYDPPAGKSIPSRLRDLLVGTTNKNSRRAIPISELRAELGAWLGTGVDAFSSVRTNELMPRGPEGLREIAAKLAKARSRGDWSEGTQMERAYENIYEPGPTRPAADFFQRFRDVARESGLQAAGIINQAMLNAASTSGVEFDKVWCAHMDRRTRHTHFAADGQKARVEDPFFVGGAELEYPGDPSGPSQEVRNCRCRVGMAPPDAPLPREQRRNSAQRNEIIHRQRQGIIRAREDPAGLGFVPPALLAESMTASSPTEQENIMSDGEFRTFTDAVVAFIGTPTSDGRMLRSDITLTFRAFPLPLMWMKQGAEGHTSAYTVGVIESAEQRDNTIVASGYLLNTAEADEAADQLAHGVTRPSVDLAAASWVVTDRDGNEISEDSDGEVFMTITEAELIGTTLVATPAFGDTTLPLNLERESRDVALVAAAAEEFRPRVYDHRLFQNPQLEGPTLPTMGDDGRIYGHLACFGECHRSIQTECVIAPRSRANYAHFHTSPAVRLDNGERLPVGRLTVGTGHASPGASGRAAAAHYDNTGTCFALVRVGEDDHGIWFSGVAAPWATADQIEQGLSSPLSGDWRDFGQGLELVAALAVNTPGFSARGRSDEQGRPIALVASLGPTDEDVAEDVSPVITADEIKAAVKEAIGEARVADLEAKRAAEKSELLERASRITRPPTPAEEIADLLARR